MRRVALEFTARGRVAFRDLPKPADLGESEIWIETEYSAITNVIERRALLSEHGYGCEVYPSRHGYQHVGRVVGTGEKVTNFRSGDRVFYGNYVGHNGFNIATEDDLLVRLPPEADHKYCSLFGVAAVALRAARRMRIGTGDNVWVAGQGPIGHFLAQSARIAGAMVTVTDMNENRLKSARENGAHIALCAGDGETAEIIRRGAPYSHIFDCCGAEGLLSDIFKDQLLAYGGTVGMMAVRDTVVYPWSLLHGTEAKIETSCHFDNDDLRVLLFLLLQQSIHIAPMVSHVVPFDDAPSMYNMLANNTDDLFGVIFDWG